MQGEMGSVSETQKCALEAKSKQTRELLPSPGSRNPEKMQIGIVFPPSPSGGGVHSLMRFLKMGVTEQRSTQVEGSVRLFWHTWVSPHFGHLNSNPKAMVTLISFVD